MRFFRKTNHLTTNQTEKKNSCPPHIWGSSPGNVELHTRPGTVAGFKGSVFWGPSCAKTRPVVFWTCQVRIPRCLRWKSICSQADFVFFLVRCFLSMFAYDEILVEQPLEKLTWLSGICWKIFISNKEIQFSTTNLLVFTPRRISGCHQRSEVWKYFVTFKNQGEDVSFCAKKIGRLERFFSGFGLERWVWYVEPYLDVPGS